ncbi:hypothetical protein GCWU000324_00751 [Kingella oralis ATCC 51147]|uniref:Uncharacterized protein n=1 Tax=Kingella oralis ATCC 51147 TaxID=629741 RepID=C4GF37_9NEIS|nr:hypothetical protein GCWU000324_00751 [Kingella oralis ATCC 51147]
MRQPESCQTLLLRIVIQAGGLPQIVGCKLLGRKWEIFVERQRQPEKQNRLVFYHAVFC